MKVVIIANGTVEVDRDSSSYTNDVIQCYLKIQALQIFIGQLK